MATPVCSAAQRDAVINRHAASVLALLALVALTGTAREQSDQLSQTIHPPLPATSSELWLVPTADQVGPRAVALYAPLVQGAEKFAAGDYAAAFPLVSQPALASTDLADYATYYTAMTHLRLSRSAEARRLFRTLREKKPDGYLSVAATLGEGEAAETLGDYKNALALYQSLAGARTTLNEDVLTRVGRSALASGDRKTAAEAYVRIYYEYPLSEAAVAAESQIDALSDQIVRTGYKADLGRAQILYGARRYPEARAAFIALQRSVSGDDRELVDLRIAECEFFLKRYAPVRDGVAPYLENGSRKAEAQFFFLSAQRELGEHEQFIEATRALVAAFPDSSWAEEALNNLGTHYILTNQDDLAAAAFRELYEKFPNGTRAERAAWKYGWYRSKTGEYRGSDTRLRECSGGLLALRLPAVVPLLGRSRTWQARFGIGSDRASAPRPCGLWQLVLRSSRAAPAPERHRPGARGGGSRVVPVRRIDAAPHRASDPAAARRRFVRRCAERAALCAAGLGNFRAGRRHDRVGLSPSG